MASLTESLTQIHKDIEENNIDSALNSLASLPTELQFCWEICYLRAKSALKQDRLEDAIAELKLAIIDSSSEPQAYLELIQCLIRASKHIEAKIFLEKLIEHFDEESLSFFSLNIADFFLGCGAHDRAVAWAKIAIQKTPENWESYNLLGVALHRQSHILEGLNALKQALQLNPNSPIVHHNVSNLLHQKGSFKLALHHMERAFMIDAKSANIALLYYYSIMFLDLERAKIYGKVLKEQIDTIRPDFIEPFPWLMLTDEGSIIQKVNKKNAAKFKTSPKDKIRRPVGERIRIGYLSNDFTHHATSFLIRALLQQHDHNKFDVIGFDFTDINDTNGYRSDISDSFSQMHALQGTSDADAARLIQECHIDILVDLKGYTKGSRPGIMFKQPAPIQVNFLGYPATMGSPAIDYIIGDPVVTPLNHAQWYTEQIVQLPCCYQPNDPDRKLGNQSSRSDHQLNNDWFVFANFNYCTKFTEPLIQAWSEILAACPRAVLWVLAPGDIDLSGIMGRYGIPKHQLVTVEPANIDKHLERLRHADLCLDTFPCNGHTTCSDALFAGVPTLTIAGNYFQSRVAASLMHFSGAEELICRTTEDYVKKAIAIYNDQSHLDQIKKGLRTFQPGGPYDIDGYTRKLESAYRAMVEDYLRGEMKAIKVADIEVD
jgi:protein O-GlcNAc transferase